MSEDEYLCKRTQLYNQREEGFRIIKRVDTELKALDTEYKSSKSLLPKVK
jgi:hypothetical protein